MGNCVSNKTNNISTGTTQRNVDMETYLKQKAAIEDQTDYQFIQRLVKELTQSCALPLPVPADAMPQLIIQAAEFFWQNDDSACEERWYCLPYSSLQIYGPNKLVKLPPQILSVIGVYKTSETFSFGVMGDFALERIILNNTALASNLGGSMSSMFGDGVGGYNLTDVMAGLYEISTFRQMFDTPITYDYNMFSNWLELMGDVDHSNIILDVFKRVKIQDLYKNYYFFRYCVCLGMRAMATILGTFEYKLPGGITLNYSRFDDIATNEMERIQEYLRSQSSPYYIFNPTTI